MFNIVGCSLDYTTQRKSERKISLYHAPFTQHTQWTDSRGCAHQPRPKKTRMNEAEKYNNYWFIIINLNVSVGRFRDKRHATTSSTTKNKKAHIKMSIKWFNILPQRSKASYMHRLNYTSYIFTSFIKTNTECPLTVSRQNERRSLRNDSVRPVMCVFFFFPRALSPAHFTTNRVNHHQVRVRSRPPNSSV